MRIKGRIVRKGGLDTLYSRITNSAKKGLEIGGQMMAEAVKVSITDLARYPTGELAGTVKYEAMNSAEDMIVGRIVASGDHARWFEQGASLHFVSIESVDERVIEGLYENAIPVYKYPREVVGGKPKTSYEAPTQIRVQSTELPIGYLISSSPHPFMEEGFKAQKDLVVREVANQIESEIGG